MRSNLYFVSFVVSVAAAACSAADDDLDRDTSRESERATGATEPPPGGTGGATGASTAIEHLLVTGQSNAISFAGGPPLSRTQPFTNLMFDVGVMTARGCDDDGCREYAPPTRLVPLTEGDTYFDYPVETVGSGFANEAARLMKRGPFLVSIHGRSGNLYECLRKSGCNFFAGRGYVGAFDEAMRQVEDGKRLAAGQGTGYSVGAVAVVHGESDHYAPPFPLDGTDGARGSVRSYADALLEWQRDYDASIRKLTAQTAAVPLLVSQMSNWNDRVDSEIPLRQLEAHGRAPGDVVVVGPTYMLPFAQDCIHFTNEGERRLGEYFGKAYARLRETGRYEPLRPLEARLSGDAVTVRFEVQTPPLVLDPQRVTDPGAHGFEFVDGAGTAVKVTGVEITGADTVTIRLAWAPDGGRIRYAMRATPFTCPGPQTGPRGTLRDSDRGESNYGYDLFNWSVHFEMPVAMLRP